ncbi:MAG: sugar phosphate isomerase/epimerase, partial [Candidatus Bathyarchaeia archaeon]
MFKLSVITDEVSQDLEVAARFAQRFNLNGLEIRSLWGKKPQELLGDLGKIKTILSDYGLEISAIAPPFFKADIDSEKEYQKHLEILRNCNALAKGLDANIVRGFTFWRKGRLDYYLERIIEKFQKPLEIIEAEGIMLGIENEPSTFVGNGRELALFLDRLGSKNVKAIWDPGNDTFDPSGEIPYPDGYSHVRGRIVHVHLKDGIRRGAEGKYEAAAIGEGDVDYL